MGLYADETVSYGYRVQTQQGETYTFEESTHGTDWKDCAERYILQHGGTIIARKHYVSSTYDRVPFLMWWPSHGDVSVSDMP